MPISARFALACAIPLHSTIFYSTSFQPYTLLYSTLLHSISFYNYPIFPYII